MYRVFWKITAASFCMFASYAILLSAIPFELESRLINPAVTGSVLAAFPIGIILVRITMLRSVDRIDWRISCVVGGFFAFLSVLLLLFLDSPMSIAVSRFLHGLGFTLLTTSAIANIGAMASSDNRGKLLGVYSATTSISLVLFPPLGIWISKSAAFAPNAYIALIFSIGAIVFSLKLPRFPNRSNPNDGKTSKHRSLWPLYLCVSLCAAPLGAMETTLPYLSAAHKLQIIGTVYFLWGAFIVLGRLGGGFIYDRTNTILPFYISLFVGVSGLATPILWTGNWAYVVGSILGGTGVGITTSYLTCQMSAAVPAERQGSTLGLATLYYNLVFAAAAALGGASLNLSSVGPLIFSIAALAIIGLSSVVFGKIKNGQANPYQNRNPE